MKVYPAASLIDYIKPKNPIYIINTRPSIEQYQFNNLTIINEGLVLRLNNYLKFTIGPLK